MNEYIYKMIPRFSDFDSYGIVHHSQYLKFVEEGRIQMVRDIFKQELEEIIENDINVFVMDVYIKYVNFIQNARPILVALKLKLVEEVYLHFDFKIMSEERKTYAKGYIRLCFSKVGKGMMLNYPENFKTRVYEILDKKNYDFLTEERRK